MSRKVPVITLLLVLLVVGLINSIEVSPVFKNSKKEVREVSSDSNLSQEEMIDFLDHDCTPKLAAECAIVIELTILDCSKAFETEGSDIIADLKCAKDLLANRKTCWPCICYEAEKKGWKIVGC